MFFLVVFLVVGSYGLKCHVNVGNEKYIANAYDTEDCPEIAQFCFTREVNGTDYFGDPSTTRIYGCDQNGNYCRYGRGCFRESYSQLTCCCPNDDCNSGLKSSTKLKLWIPLVFTTIKVLV